MIRRASFVFAAVFVFAFSALPVSAQDSAAGEEGAVFAAPATVAAPQEAQTSEPVAEQEASPVATPAPVKVPETPVAEQQKKPAPVVVSKADLDAELGGTSAELEKLAISVQKLYEQRKAQEGKPAALSEAYGQYASDLEKAQARLKSLGSACLGVKTNTQAYFNTWKAEIAAIQNEKIRRTGEKRFEAFTEKFGEFNQGVEEFDKQVSAVASNLEDVRKYLKYDLRTESLEQISGTLDDAGDEFKDLQKNVVKLRKMLQELPEVGSPSEK
jgi:chromosome segregation ATPase